MCEFTGRKVVNLSESGRNKGKKGLRPIAISTLFGNALHEPKKAIEKDMSSGEPQSDWDLLHVPVRVGKYLTLP